MDPQIAEAFERGVLVRRTPSTFDIVDLSRAVARVGGVSELTPEAPPPPQALLDRIGGVEHLVFVLLDGLGMNLLRRLPRAAFLVEHLAGELLATCPSTTACALTSVATGAWPAQHGVTGWFTYVPEHALSMTSLRLNERFSGAPLAERGLEVKDLFPLQAFHTRLAFRSLTLLPAAIADTAFARYSRGGTRGHGYEALADAVEMVVAHVHAAPQPSFSHIYIPDVDTACHHDGLEAAQVMELLLALDTQLFRLKQLLPRGARLVVTADHGLLDVGPNGHLVLLDDDPLVGLLRAPPSGDARLPVFHVTPGNERVFEQQFGEKFGHAMRLMPSAEALDGGLFGPGVVSDVARSRFGDFVGIALEPVVLRYALRAKYDARAPAFRAEHAGLTPDEMAVPMIVA